jgi:hypothetical protein
MRTGSMKTGGSLFLIMLVGWGCAHVAPASEPAALSAPRVEKSQIPAKTLDEILTVAAVDPLQKIFRESSYFPEGAASADAARGEYASLQFVLRSSRNIRRLSARVEPVRSGSAVFAGASARFVGYVKVSRRAPNPSHDRLVPPSGYYPDPLLESPAIDVLRDAAQPIWVTVPVPQDASPGAYRGNVIFSGTIEGKTFRVSRPFTVNVFPVTIKGTRLWVTNWFFTDPATLKMLNAGRPVELYTPRYWELVRLLARKMKEYRQNVAWVNPLDLVKFSRAGGRWGFDFANFDKTVNLLIEEGVIGRIEGGHIGGREGGWESQFVVNVPAVNPDGTTLEKRPISDPEAAGFYGQFIPALTAHIKDKGWDGIYMQHIADEPTAFNTKTYIEIASFIKNLAPGLKVIEACHSKDVNNVVNVWVPELDYFSDDLAFYQGRQQSGDEVWFYTCLAPQGEFPNRFIELPLLKTRYVHWLNFRYGATGYLHWGFNCWQMSPDANPFLEASALQVGGNPLPGGDSWIVYPAPGKVLSSIRLEAMRDGIFDYELLKMLEDRQPEKAQEMCRKLVFSFTSYDLDIRAFRSVRAEILELLSKQPAAGAEENDEKK